ncbi:MAG: hypothetical protein KF768_05400 [Phycisphaeraceae bacterium]|nr:hypothetical protein [Phycisphaeraceae bacterium]
MIAHYVTDVSIMPHRWVGFDAVSGAWFQISNGQVHCQSVDGTQWHGSDKSELEPVPGDWCMSSSVLDAYMPWMPFYDLRAHTSAIVDVREHARDPFGEVDGPVREFEMVLPRRGRAGLWCPEPPNLPEPLRGELRVTYTVNGDGHVTHMRTTNHDGSPAVVAFVPYAAESIGKIPVVGEGPMGAKLVSYQYFPGTSGQQHFTKEAILALAREKRTGVQVFRRDGPISTLDMKTGKVVVTQSRAGDGGSSGLLGEPLALAAVVVGGAMIAAALFVRWRRGRGAAGRSGRGRA